MVVAALKAAAADIEGGGLSAQERRALKDLGVVTLPEQLESGGEAGSAAANDADPHAVPASPAAEVRSSSSRLDRASSVRVWLLSQA